MSVRQKYGTDRSCSNHFVKSSVVVAVKACKEIPRSALTWALTNVVRPGDCVRLLVVVPSHSSSTKLWGLPHFHNDCTAGHWRLMSGTVAEQKEYITDLCNNMMRQLHDVYDPDKLGCNVIIVKHSEPKVLQLNLIEPKRIKTDAPPCPKSFIKVPNVTPTTSPDRPSSNSGLDTFTSATFMSETNWEPRIVSDYDFSDSDSEILSTRSTSLCSQSSADEGSKHSKKAPSNLFSELYTNQNRNVREIISLTKNMPLDPPPLCSVCHHKTPFFGKPPKVFSYCEIEKATSGFLRDNFLADGGHGSVHRGVLSDGQVVAVKQHKLATAQCDQEFCSEVQILSCAQHRNVVMLIGYCVEDGRRLLVYEYICNGSLDSHLYGRDRDPLDWGVRQKIAVGAARGLRYLHEECRVGCIVHCDMRPNNILLTHDFEPLARPLLEANALSEHVDPSLMKCYSEKEVQIMLNCALLCLQRDPQSRPRMSQNVDENVTGIWCLNSSTTKETDDTEDFGAAYEELYESWSKLIHRINILTKENERLNRTDKEQQAVILRLEALLTKREEELDRTRSELSSALLTLKKLNSRTIKLEEIFSIGSTLKNGLGFKALVFVKEGDKRSDEFVSVKRTKRRRRSYVFHHCSEPRHIKPFCKKLKMERIRAFEGRQCQSTEAPASGPTPLQNPKWCR
ncbi:inactive protein kinase selmodraft_444075 [Phtheirospermum japonicum]|uniref:Inactive protein kinase selmodraft_444075 n=1 Tax=Phtheirospermum japonicum TaxID=374723 RepID=A0A830CL87_9LAMI|nr:inactive protein kinase selmodraft_444075 [Phtheirospermum japonicum]